MIINGIYGGSKGVEVNGVEKQYTVGDNSIRKGDFVTLKPDTELSSTYISPVYLSDQNVQMLKCVSLSDNKVFIVYKHSSGLRCRVITADSSNNITLGTEAVIDTDINFDKPIETVVINSTRVAVFYSNNDRVLLNAIICSINNTAVTIGSKTSTNIDIPSQLHGVALSDSFLWLSWNTSADLLSSVIYTISDTTLSYNRMYSYSVQQAGHSFDVCRLDNTHVFIPFGKYDSSTDAYHLYYVIGQTSGNGTGISYSGGNIPLLQYNGNSITAITLSNGNILIAHNYSSGNRLTVTKVTLSNYVAQSWLSTYITQTRTDSAILDLVQTDDSNAYMFYPISDNSLGVVRIILTENDKLIAREQSVVASYTASGRFNSTAAMNADRLLTAVYDASSSSDVKIRFAGIGEDLLFKYDTGAAVGIAKENGTKGSVVTVVCPE